MTDRSAERTDTRPRSGAAPGSGPDDTVVRPALKERVQARLAAAQESRAAAGKGGSAAKGGAEPAAASKASAAASSSRPPRRARLRLTRVDPWSVMKTAFLLSIAFGIVTVVSVLMVWTVLDAAGVWESVNASVRDVVGNSSTFDVENYLGTSRVLGFTMLIAAVDVVLLTAIATLAAFLYNMAAALLGGIEVTLAEDH